MIRARKIRDLTEALAAFVLGARVLWLSIDISLIQAPDDFEVADGTTIEIVTGTVVSTYETTSHNAIICWVEDGNGGEWSCAHDCVAFIVEEVR